MERAATLAAEVEAAVETSLSLDLEGVLDDDDDDDGGGKLLILDSI